MRYFVGFLIAIGLIILLIFLLVSGGNKPKNPVTPRTLPSYATRDSEVSMVLDGPVNSQQEHNQIRITVDRNAVIYQQIRGYNDNVVNQQTFANTQAAYEVFLRALDHAGFTKGNRSPELADERGYCPLGQRYIFELQDSGDRLERFWATSCGKPKTYLGVTSLTVTLFQNQVPGYDNLTASIQL